MHLTDMKLITNENSFKTYKSIAASHRVKAQAHGHRAERQYSIDRSINKNIAKSYAALVAINIQDKNSNRQLIFT